jgi:ethanolamine utilization protein EutP
MKKIILIGKTGSGKTTLCQNIHGEVMEYKKTQAIDTHENAIDTPGEYIENRFYYKALIVTAADADIIGLVQDCTEEDSFFPPSFGSVFPKPVIGIITKADLAKDNEDILRAKQYLEMAGAADIFTISSIKEEGVEELKKYLKNPI